MRLVIFLKFPSQIKDPKAVAENTKSVPISPILELNVGLSQDQLGHFRTEIDDNNPDALTHGCAEVCVNPVCGYCLPTTV